VIGKPIANVVKNMLNHIWKKFGIIPIFIIATAKEVVVIVAAFCIAAATVGSTTIATQALAQNMTAGDNMTMGAAGNMTAGNMTGGSDGGDNWTK
jgi:hypothetical protein